MKPVGKAWKEIKRYFSKLSVTSETNYSLWKAIKRLKRLQTQYPLIRKQEEIWARRRKN
jgi:transposase